MRIDYGSSNVLKAHFSTRCLSGPIVQNPSSTYSTWSSHHFVFSFNWGMLLGVQCKAPPTAYNAAICIYLVLKFASFTLWVVNHLPTSFGEDHLSPYFVIDSQANYCDTNAECYDFFWFVQTQTRRHHGEGIVSSQAWRCGIKASRFGTAQACNGISSSSAVPDSAALAQRLRGMAQGEGLQKYVAQRYASFFCSPIDLDLSCFRRLDNGYQTWQIMIVVVVAVVIVIIIIIIIIITIVTIITKAIIITISNCILFRPAVCPKISESSNNIPPCKRTASSSGRKKTTLGRLDWNMKFLHIQQKSGYVKSNHNLQHPVPPSNLPRRQR